jgi:hypothetical protein
MGPVVRPIVHLHNRAPFPHSFSSNRLGDEEQITKDIGVGSQNATMNAKLRRLGLDDYITIIVLDRPSHRRLRTGNCWAGSIYGGKEQVKLNVIA